MTEKKLRIAVVGGGIGQSHIRAFQSLPDQFDLVSICDIDEPKARRIAEEYKIPHVHTDLADLFSM